MLRPDNEEFILPAAAGRSYRRWASLIRLVTNNDLDHFQRHLLRLSAECRRSRFGNETTDTFLRDYASRVNPRNTLVLGLFHAGELRGAAELRSLQHAWCNEVEAAFSVERSWQSRGIGTALFAEALRTSRKLAVEHIYLSCHVRNRPMQCVAEKLAAELRFEDDECFAHLSVRREPSAIPFTDASLECPSGGFIVIDL